MTDKDAVLIQNRSKPLSSIYAIHGDEILLRNEAKDALRSAATDFYPAYTFYIDQQFSWELVFALMQPFSLFENGIRIELEFATSKLTPEMELMLEKYLNFQKKYDGYFFTIIILPRIDFAGYKSSWFKLLEKSCIVIKLASDKDKAPNFAIWIKDRLAKQKQFILKADENYAINYLISQSGNLLNAAQEIEKLKIVYPPGALNLRQIYEVVVLNDKSLISNICFNVFDLPIAILKKDLNHLSNTLDNLRLNGVPEVLVLWVITKEMRLLYKLQLGLMQNKNLGQLLREYKIWGEHADLLATTLSQVSLSKLKIAFSLATQLDLQIKGLPSTLISDVSLPFDVWLGFFEILKIAIFDGNG